MPFTTDKYHGVVNSLTSSSAQPAAAAASLPTATVTKNLTTNNGSSQAITFGVLGTCIGVVSIVLAALTLRFMYQTMKRKRSDLESIHPNVTPSTLESNIPVATANEGSSQSTPRSQELTDNVELSRVETE
ncbi:hypothetical protein BU24DRAFT_491794 [Aaosphaeria arxii CBS 175.79]|uniref:Uncharacterized protein n=1 Tax=Aaosphaeria arxii CBS 175.79 TaxID=1450172 RepID=A0A6A5XQJ4_9PLEO|nr:uncharacterized protein BU24DRAFT_491794 [Aaosphaeria arxii CBS 175.79]KAF2015565.1 hypothetical protein BU24DRAFT_491794 [Aaosphaeria arxii CBS 175.79]